MNSTYRSGTPAAKLAVVIIGWISVQNLMYLSAGCRKSQNAYGFSLESELVKYLNKERPT